nr:transposon TX1 putative 149 kDa protein [Tanacetum cinerariifolium]
MDFPLNFTVSIRQQLMMMCFKLSKIFFLNGHFPSGCNSSFIALIPKIQDAKFVKDFRHVSLIKSVYIDRHSSEGDHSAVRTHMRILSVVRIEVFSLYGYDYMKKIVLCRADLNGHVIAERDFKYLYPSDFEDLYLLNLQGHLNHLPPKDKKFSLRPSTNRPDIVYNRRTRKIMETMNVTFDELLAMDFEQHSSKPEV